MAISGGEDSVALLHYLKSLEKEGEFSLLAVHCEHGIRGEESLEDMRFVEALCKEWSIPLFIFREDCVARAKREKESLETSARNFRYESFSTLLKQGKTDFIATAHHGGDEAETLLFRLARGSSLSGLKGMQEANGGYLRPILSWSKEKIRRYIEENKLSYRVDSTNLLTDATRNKIRLEVLPALERAVNGATQNIARFALVAAADDELLYELSDALVERDGERITVLFSDKKPLFTRAALTAMKALGVEKDYTSAHLNAIFDLQKSERGAWLTLPKNIRAKKGEKGIVFSLGEEEIPLPVEKEQPFGEKSFDGGRYEVNISSTPISEDGKWKILRLDGDKIPANAVFRFRREGDSIRRFGGGKKSLKKFFNEEKIPPKERAHLPIIADEEGRVYAVCGVEIAEAVKVDADTKNPLYISLRRKEN